jgi:hypothetical protein
LAATFAAAFTLLGCGNDVIVLSATGTGSVGSAGGGAAHEDARPACTGRQGWHAVPDPLQQDITRGGWTGDELILWGTYGKLGYRFHSVSEGWREMAPIPPVLSPKSAASFGALSSGRFFVWDEAGGAAYDWSNGVWDAIAGMGGPPTLAEMEHVAVVSAPTHLIQVDRPYGPVDQWPPTLTGKIYQIASDAPW